MNDLSKPNGPFPSCCLSRFRSESWCSTIVREMSLICIRIRNSFPSEWLCTRTRFETEACSNWEMGYYYIICHSSFSAVSSGGWGSLFWYDHQQNFKRFSEYGKACGTCSTYIIFPNYLTNRIVVSKCCRCGFYCFNSLLTAR